VSVSEKKKFSRGKVEGKGKENGELTFSVKETKIKKKTVQERNTPRARMRKNLGGGKRVIESPSSSS